MAKVIAIDVGASHLRGALISREGKILDKKKQETKKKGETGEIITKQIIKLIGSLNNSQAEAITIASIGPLDRERGGIVNTPNLPFDFIPLLKPLSSKFSLPLQLVNDCQAAAWGEYTYGAGESLKNIVYITISTGIGGGAIVDGHLLKGKEGNAVEIGHQIIEQEYNFKCSCNKGRGHWEGVASGKNIPRFFKKWSKKRNLKFNFKIETSKDIFDHIKNKGVSKFIKEGLGEMNARAVSNIIVFYNPSLITFGGAIPLNHKDLILEPIKNKIDHFLKEPEIKISPLGEGIVLLGAAAFFFNPPK